MQEPASPDIPIDGFNEFIKTPPFSMEAEQSVLGGLMLNNEAWIAIADLLTETDFYRREHQLIFKAIRSLVEEGYPCDPLTLSEWLEQHAQLEATGGGSYLGLLVTHIPSAANIVAYAEIVREHSILRQLVRVGNEIAESAFNTQGRKTTQLLDNAEQMVFEIAELGARSQTGFIQIEKILNKTLEQMERLSQQEGMTTGIATGFNDFDKQTSGLQRSDLIIIAGRPSMGKCLVGHSKIMMADGQLVTIQEIYQRQMAQLLTLNVSAGTFHLTQPTAFIYDGIKPVFRITTQLGRQIETTLTHPFLTNQGWQALSHLTAGDKIAVPRIMNVFGTTPLPICEIKLIVYFLGPACLLENELIFLHPNPKIQNDFIEAFQDFSGVPIQVQYTETGAINLLLSQTVNQQVRAWLKDFIQFDFPQSLSIPPAIFTLPQTQLTLFLNRLWAITANEQPERFLGYTHTNESLVREIQHLLLRFGIIAALKPDELFQFWQLEINEPQSIQYFVNEIGLFIQEDSWSDLNNPLFDDNQIYWDEIVAIESIHCQPVYDLTIPNTHNFVANDICVHNTSFAMNIAEHVAVREQLPVAVFSMEMSSEQIAMRLISSLAKVNLQKVRTGKLEDDDWSEVTEAMGQLSESPLFIDETPALNPTELRARVRRLAREKGQLGLVVIDYLQLMQIPNNKENRAVEVSEISRALKSLAKELSVPVLALSQLNRGLEQRPDKRPRMADLRESGSLEQDADLVVFIYRDEVYNEDSASKGTAEIIIAKQRNGPIGHVTLTFRNEITRFDNHLSENYFYGEQPI